MSSSRSLGQGLPSTAGRDGACGRPPGRRLKLDPRAGVWDGSTCRASGRRAARGNRTGSPLDQSARRRFDYRGVHQREKPPPWAMGMERAWGAGVFLAVGRAGATTYEDVRSRRPSRSRAARVVGARNPGTLGHSSSRAVSQGISNEAMSDGGKLVDRRLHVDERRARYGTLGRACSAG